MHTSVKAGIEAKTYRRGLHAGTTMLKKGNQSIHLGDTSDYESVPPALVQMKVSAGAMEG